MVPGVLSPDEVQTCLDLTWDWLESLGSGIERSDPTTWTDNNWPGEFQSGITVKGQNQQISEHSISCILYLSVGEDHLEAMSENV